MLNLVEIDFDAKKTDKRRVERNHAVYQDRFVKALKLKSITTIKDANKLLENGFVDDLNQRFAKLPSFS